MDRGEIASLLFVLGLVGLAVFLLVSPPGGDVNPGELNATTSDPPASDTRPDRGDDGYDWTTVTVESRNGTRLATVDVRIADTSEKLYTGLSETEELPPDEGMLFVHDEEDTYTYVMREMDFPLDIIFVAANGTITTIHHAPVPEEIPGGNGRFSGRGQYVLEVNRGWANRTGVEPGDRVVIPGDGGG